MNPSNAPHKKTEYQSTLEAMTDEKLFEETKSKIWLSAYANNNPRSCYHWQCDFTYDEWMRRGKGDQYGIAHKQVVAENR